MAWEISHTPEAWDNARHNLMHMPKYWLIDAAKESVNQIKRDKYYFQYAKELYGDTDILKVTKQNLRRCAKDTIVSLIIQLIEVHKTCDSGGYNFYIDPGGWYEVSVDSECTRKNCPYNPESY